MKIVGSNSISKVENCITTKIENITILLNLETGKYIKLNESASIIWETIEQSNSVDHLKEIVSELMNASINEIGDDIESFLEEAIEKKIIMVV